MATQEKMTKRQLLRLEGSLRHAEKVFSRIARIEHRTQSIINRTDRKIEKFSSSLKEKDTPLLEKLAQKHQASFDELCEIVESIEQRSGHKLFSGMLGRYGIRALANAVEIDTGFTEEEIIRELEKSNPDTFKKYVEVEKSLDRNLLKKDKPRISGITYVGDTGREEYFSIVKPSGEEKLKPTTKPRKKKA